MGFDGWKQSWAEALRLNTDLAPITDALRRMHSAVTAKFPEPVWPEVMRSGTRYEYRYWQSQQEIEWRIAVAEEMAETGSTPAAIFFLRFCAYAVARIPMVYACAEEGRDVSFLRPERAVLPELNRLHPEIIPDLNQILSGETLLEERDVKDSIQSLVIFRDRAFECLTQKGINPGAQPDWIPYQLQAA
jgi:hypothetical protein